MHTGASQGSAFPSLPLGQDPAIHISHPNTWRTTPDRVELGNDSTNLVPRPALRSMAYHSTAALPPFYLSVHGSVHTHTPITTMPLPLSATGSTLAIKRDAFEHAGLTRETVDRVLNLTDAEFRIEGGLIAVGPLPSPDDVPNLIEMFEDAGLVYFDDFMEIPGGFPDWLELYARHRT